MLKVEKTKNIDALNSQNFEKVHLVLCRPGFSDHLANELRHQFQIDATAVHPSAVEVKDNITLPALKDTIFARQSMPNSFLLKTPNIEQVVEQIIKRLLVITKREKRQDVKWTIHAFAIDDDTSLAFALKVEKKLRATLTQKHSELFKKYIDQIKFITDSVAPTDLVLQIFAPSQESIYFSINSVASGVSKYCGGMQRMKKIHDAPSRSASKLMEALLFMGRTPEKNSTAVDLGAAPGGWSMVMAFHGANVTAIDHGMLDLPKKPKWTGSITHLEENGLKYLPTKPVDWLCCDMVLKGSQTLEVLENWIEGQHMKNFVVNVKLPPKASWSAAFEVIDFCNRHKEDKKWKLFAAKHLFHDRNELTLMGSKA